MDNDERRAIGRLIALARDGLEGGKDVAVYAPGIDGFVMGSIEPMDEDGIVTMVGRYASIEGRVFHVVASTIRWISVGDPIYP